jgi:hypothetical protein
MNGFSWGEAELKNKANFAKDCRAGKEGGVSFAACFKAG